MARECPECGISFEWGAAWASHMRNKHPDAAVSGEDPPSGSSNGSTTEGPEEAVRVEPDMTSAQLSEPATPEGDTDEKVPQAHPESATERAKSLVARLRQPRERKARVLHTGPRQSGADLFQFLWAQSGGMIMARNRRDWHVPVGRTMSMQSPMVGQALDEVVKGTFIDPLLQFALRQSDRGQLLLAIGGPPLIAYMLSASPEMMPALAPFMDMFMLTVLEQDAKAIKKKASDERRIVKTLAEVEGLVPPDLLERAKADGISPIRAAWMYQVFAPLGEEQTAPPEAEPAVA